MLTAITRSVDETRELAASIARILLPGDVIILSGDLGAGKTAFTQALGAEMGVSEIITSPTFALVQPYQGTQLGLFHLDVYRLNHRSEVEDLGLVEMFEEPAVTVIEWGERIVEALPADRLEVAITQGSDPDERRFDLRACGAGWAERIGSVDLHQIVEHSAC